MYCCCSEFSNESNKTCSVISVLEGGGSFLDPQSTPSLHETLSRLREKIPHTHQLCEGLRPSGYFIISRSRPLRTAMQRHRRRLQIFRRNSHIYIYVQNFISTSSAACIHCNKMDYIDKLTDRRRRACLLYHLFFNNCV